MADKKSKKAISNTEKLSDKYAKKILTYLDSTTDEVDQIDLMNSTFRSVVNTHLNQLKDSSNGAIIDFIKLSDERKNKNSSTSKGFDNNDVDFLKQIQDNATNLYGALSEQAKNTYAKYLDIEYIIKFNPALRKAINMAVNQICTSDEADDTMVYKLKFGSSFSDEEQIQVRSIMDKVDDEYSLRRKIKNNLIAPAIEIGTSYCYVKPYSEIFSEYNDLKKKENKLDTHRNSNGSNMSDISAFATESFKDMCDPIVYPVSRAYEGITILRNESNFTERELTTYRNEEGDFPNFILNTSKIPEDVLVDAMSFKALESSAKPLISTGTGSKTGVSMTSSAVMDSSDTPVKHGKNPFDKYSGVYIKIMKYNNIVPITVFGEKVCYLYIHSNKKKFKQDFSSRNGMNLLNSVSGPSKNNKEKIFDNLVNGLCNKIAQDFSLQFLDNNLQFKKQIAECLITNGFSDNKYKIQIIPASDIIEFNIKIDENGDGHSLLEDSIVTGKMGASLTVSKLLNYLNKSGDRTLVNFTKNPMDSSGNNMLQSVIRNFQESDINLPDILSGELLFNKIGRNNRIAIPRDENGTRVLEFEQLEGQRVELNTEYEDYLNKLALLGAETPSSILDFTDQVDFAKQVTTTNIAYAIMISGLQSDLESSITDLYRKILIHAGIPDELRNKVNGPDFKIVLSRPRVLSNSNLFDAYSSTQQLAEQLASLYATAYGIGNDDPKLEEYKAKFQLMYMKDNLSLIEFDKYETIFKEIVMEIQSEPPAEDTNNMN